MHRPLTWLAGIGGTILMLLSACSAGSDRTPSEPPTIKIGVIIPTKARAPPSLQASRRPCASRSTPCHTQAPLPARCR